MERKIGKAGDDGRVYRLALKHKDSTISVYRAPEPTISKGSMEVVLLELLSKFQHKQWLEILTKRKRVDWTFCSLFYRSSGCYLNSILNKNTSPYKDVYLLHSSILTTGKNL